MAIRPLNEIVEALEQKHSQDQEQIADDLVMALYPLWMIVNFEDLDRSTVLWVEAVIPRVRTAYYQSQRVAAAFAENVRFASLPTAEPTRLIVPDVEPPMGVPRERFDLPDIGDPGLADGTIAFDEFPEDDVRLSLLVEGNYSIKKQMPAGDPREVMAHARANATGASVRQALKGARNVTNNIVQFDRKALGYARFTDGNPCHFCALLASRGAVYGKQSFADSDASFTANKRAIEVPDDFIRISKVHNNCRCTLRPVYTKSSEFDAEAKFYRKQWKDIWEPNKALPPDEIVQKWREQYKPYEREPADVAKLSAALRDRESALLAEGYDPSSPQVRWAQRTQSLLA